MLTLQEQETLEEAKAANEHWFHALLEAAHIMTERRKKYAGKGHAYANFTDMSYRLNEPTHKIFLFYLNLKASRLSTTDQDFTDERVLDTWIDVANYALIAAGWSLDQLNNEQIIPKEEWENIRNVGDIDENTD